MCLTGFVGFDRRVSWTATRVLDRDPCGSRTPALVGTSATPHTAGEARHRDGNSFRGRALPGGMSRSRKVFIIIGGAVAFLLLLLLGVTLLVPVERIGRVAVDQAEEALDREVRMEGFGIRFLPRPAVTVEGVTVSRHARSGDPPPDGAGRAESFLAAAERIELRPRILPLLRREVVVNEVALEAPEVWLVAREDGTLDLPEVEGDPEADGMEVEIQRILVRNGRIEYRDPAKGDAVVLSGVDHTAELAGALGGRDGEPLVLEGVGSVAELRAELPEALDRPLEGIRVSMDHHLELDQEADLLEVRTLDLTVQDLPLGLTGRVEALSDPGERAVRLEGSAEGVDAAQLVDALPREVRQGLPGAAEGEALVGTGGHLDLEALVEGPVGEGQIPEVSGLVRLSQVALAYGAQGDPGGPLVEDLEGDFEFSLENASTDGLTGTLLGEPFQVGFRVEDLREDPRGTMTVDGAVELAEARRLDLLPQDVDGTGRVRVSVTAEGRGQEPERATFDGSVELSDVELETPAFAVPVRLDGGRMELAGREVRSEGLAATLGESDVTVDFRVDEFLSLAFPDQGPRPTAEAVARAGLLDLDALFDQQPDRTSYGQLLFAELGGQEVDGRSAPEHARDQGLSLPELPDLRLDGRVEAGTVVSNGIAHQDLEAVLSLEEDVVELPSIRFASMGGGVELSGRLGEADADGARAVTLEYQVADVTADPFLEHHTLFRGRLGGSLHLTGSAEMVLGSNTLPLRETVGAQGALEIVDGELREWPLVRELGASVGVSDIGPLEVREWRGGFRVEGARFLIEESTLAAGDLMVRSSGSFDVAGNLDFTATFELPREWLAEVPGVPSGLLDAVLGGRDGTVPVDATISGTTGSPSIGLDLPGIGG